MDTKKPTFEQAINVATLWCKAWENGELSDEVLADRVSELLTSNEGARGFFVVSLAGDCPILDRMPDPLVLEMRKAGESVIDLTVRNLAMSSAISLHHERNCNHIQKEGSQRVKYRCIELLRQLEPNLVKRRLEKLLEALNGKGDDVSFLERWDYDFQQKQAIRESINQVPEQ